jgi:hypothetical protein
VSYGLLIDGLSTSTVGASVFDSFTLPAGASVNKAYSSAILGYATGVQLYLSPYGGIVEHEMYTPPSLAAALSGQSLSVTGVGGTVAFSVVVLLK